MILGIDPKNDYAFKCVFGSQRHTRVLIHMLNAVLKPPPERRILSVEILNPISEPVVLDEKLSILDVKASDQSGRQFNVEMQMATHPRLQERFLYYWAKLYSGQLQSGDQYEALRPVISICFLDALLFPKTDQFHLPFRLYFLNNGIRLDPDQLPKTMRVPEVEEAVGVLKMLTQDEIERERYEAREKARRDALSWESAMERRQAEALEQGLAKGRAEGQKEGRQKGRKEGRSEGLAEGLIGQLRLCEQFLKQPPLPAEQLAAMSVDELERLVDQMRNQLSS